MSPVPSPPAAPRGAVDRRRLLKRLAAAGLTLPLAACAGGGSPEASAAPTAAPAAALAAASGTASAVTPATASPATATSSAGPDPLARYRLKASAPAAQWAAHLDLSRLRGAPQVLALSSGAEDGAFGAGALCGWSGQGDRPDFDIVTGVSTGALIAPFAFLGPGQDATLRAMFLDHDARDIMRLDAAGIVAGGALYDTSPLAALIETFTPEPVLDAIARRHRAGGRLFVVTAHVETSQGVVWNLGEIAARGRIALFRAVLRASSALPGLFAPVTLDVTSGGETIRETHVDGGVQMQVLATPAAAFEAPRRARGGGNLHLVVNNTLEPAPQAAARSALGLSQQALTAMVRAELAASVNAARALARRHGFGFALARVTPEAGVTFDPGERFSHAYMAALFNHGYRRAVEGRLWEG